MKKCYKLVVFGCNYQYQTYYRCSAAPITTAPSDTCGPIYLVDVEGTFNKANSTCFSVNITTVPCANCGDCCSDQIDPDQKFDCLNGGCVPSNIYGTPGKYASLTACQAGCAKDSNCTGECVSVAELQALQQAANNLKSKFCG